MSYEIAFYFLVMAAGVFVLIRAGVYIVHALVRIAHFLKLSEFVLSFVLMAIATSLPELGIGINAALSGDPLISLGNVVGANIIVLSLVLGVVLILGGTVKIGSDVSLHAHWIHFLLAISPLLLFYDGVLSRFDGVILMILFVVATILMFRARSPHVSPRVHEAFLRHFSPASYERAFHRFLRDVFVLIVSLALLLGSAFSVVYAAEYLALSFGASSFLIGALVVAIGTTLPELTFGIKAVMSRHGGLSLGNLFGTVVFNSTWILGMVSFLHPIVLTNPFSFFIDAAFMIFVMFCAYFFLLTGKVLTRAQGVFLVALYLVFLFVQMRFLW